MRRMMAALAGANEDQEVPIAPLRPASGARRVPEVMAQRDRMRFRTNGKAIGREDLR
jgi:hypothetical protein